jgi:hypothetical protein
MHITLAKPPLFGKKAEDRNRAICQAFEAGSSVVECMRQFNLGRERLYQILRKNGLAMYTRNGGRPSANPAAQFDASDEVEVCAVPLSGFDKALISSGAKRKFNLLDQESQDIVKTAFRRHVKACRSLEVPIDMHFLPDAVFEAGRMAKARREAQA